MAYEKGMPYEVETELSTTNQFSVYQFFSDGNYECVRSFVSAKEAGEAFRHYTNNLATMLGMVERIILIDGDDFINAEWIKGIGLTFPRPEDFEAARERMNTGKDSK